VKESYFVIRGSEDGDATISEHTAADLQAKLAEGYWGRVRWADTPPCEDIREFSPHGIIIRGRIVQPRPVDVVKTWELP
jgi:hypothetical protein